MPTTYGPITIPAGTWSVVDVAAAIQAQVGDDISVIVSGNTLVLQTTGSGPGTYLLIEAPEELGISGLWAAKSDRVAVYEEGSTFSVNPIPLVDVGDLVKLGSSSERIKKLSEGFITLTNPAPTYQGPVEVQSAVVVSYQALYSELDKFLSDWTNLPEAQDLSRLDALMARALSSPAGRTEALRELDSLRENLTELESILAAEEVALHPSSATEERKVVDGILASLEERRYDRAVDLLLKCKVLELFELDHDTASFGGNLLRAMSNLAQTDFQFPNRAADEGDEVKGIAERIVR